MEPALPSQAGLELAPASGPCPLVRLVAGLAPTVPPEGEALAAPVAASVVASAVPVVELVRRSLPSSRSLALWVTP